MATTTFVIARWNKETEEEGKFKHSWWVHVTEKVDEEYITRKYCAVPEEEVQQLFEALRFLNEEPDGQYNFCVQMNEEGAIFFHYIFDQDEIQFRWMYDIIQQRNK